MVGRKRLYGKFGVFHLASGTTSWYFPVSGFASGKLYELKSKAG